MVSEDYKEKKYMVGGVASFQTEDDFEFIRGCLRREEYNEKVAECQPTVKDLVLYPNVWYNEL